MPLETKYFVLKPHGSSAFAKASRSAMIAFAGDIQNEDMELSTSLLDWVMKEERAVREQEIKESAHSNQQTNDAIALLQEAAKYLTYYSVGYSTSQRINKFLAGV